MKRPVYPQYLIASLNDILKTKKNNNRNNESLQLLHFWYQMHPITGNDCKHYKQSSKRGKGCSKWRDRNQIT